MKRSNLVLLILTLLTVACQPTVDRFTLNGQIAEADGQMLYLDHMGHDRIETVDSVRLDSVGIFCFSQPATKDCFDFYRLRVDGRAINLAIDSTETVSIIASLPLMHISYAVQGSENSALIKEMVFKQVSLLRDLRSMASAYRSPDRAPLQQRMKERIDVFKSEITTRYILPDPSSAAAYYALFLSINGQMLFNPQADRQDAKCFAAVATQMDMLYPDATRTAHLHNVALKGMTMTAPSNNDGSVVEQIVRKFGDLIEETGIIEIELPDYEGHMQKLTDLKGKVVLLDFTAYKTNYSPNYNLMLKGLYNKYADQGFTIYQVSVDSDESFWLNTAPNLPWISVYDEASLGSTYLKLYNVEQIPAAFLIDRKGNIVDRPDESDQLDSKIAELLR